MNEFEALIKHVDAEDTVAKHRDTIKRLAEEAFKDHEITVEDETVFYCAKPGTGIYSFRVAFLPAGMIVIYGDIGEMMVQRGGYGWLKGSIRHDYVSDYVFEKVRPFRRWNVKEFQPGEALGELKALYYGVPLIEDGKNLVEEAKELGVDPDDEDYDPYDYWESQPKPELALKIAHDWLDYDVTGQDADAWSRAYYEHTNDCEYPDCRDYNANDLWCYHALSWFVRKREET